MKKETEWVVWSKDNSYPQYLLNLFDNETKEARNKILVKIRNKKIDKILKAK